MQYLLLIYDNEQNWTKLSDAESKGIMGEFRTFTQDIATSGHYKGGNQLAPTTSVNGWYTFLNSFSAPTVCP